MKNKVLLLWLLFIGGGLFLFFFAISAVVMLFRKDDYHVYPRGNIGVVEVSGIIEDSKEINEQLEDFEKDSDIKGVIVRIDSPGGSVGPSQEIYEQIATLRKKKKVVASMASVAASGGYYVAAAADKIVANPGTLTGSIGVIMEFINYQDLMKWAKMKPETIKSGKFKDIGNSAREMKPEERALLEVMLRDVHDQFKGDILKGRPSLTKEKLDEIADGRILTGAQAKKVGLVDELGSMQRAVKLLAKLAGIKDEPQLVYATKDDEPSWLRLFETESALSSLLERLGRLPGAKALMNPLPRLE